jgi:hypothetical integral membrane protein (TIGR02206 family)
VPTRVAAALFVPFGATHLLTLGIVAAVAAALVLAARRLAGKGPTAVRALLAAALLGATAATLAAFHAERGLSAWDLVPLHLCDMLILVAAFALLRLSQRAYELLYFWSGGTLIAMFTPDLALGFPDWRFLAYFGLHGGVVAAAVLLTLGFGMRPAPGAAWRAWLLTNLYAAAVGLVDLAFDQNFLYLCRKPATPTLLDWLGPWPWYVVTADALALAIFVAMAWPFGVRPERAP